MHVSKHSCVWCVRCVYVLSVCDVRFVFWCCGVLCCVVMCGVGAGVGVQCVVCGVCGVCGVCACVCGVVWCVCVCVVCGAAWHAEKPAVCRFKTSPCVGSKTRAPTLFYRHFFFLTSFVLFHRTFLVVFLCSLLSCLLSQGRRCVVLSMSVTRNPGCCSLSECARCGCFGVVEVKLLVHWKKMSSVSSSSCSSSYLESSLFLVVSLNRTCCLVVCCWLGCRSRGVKCYGSCWLAPSLLAEHVRIMQETVLAYLCKPRATWKEVGLHVC